MKQTDVIAKISKLPDDMLQSASDYLDFLLLKAQQEGHQETKNNKRELGKYKGIVTYIAPDFDAPLDDMKEYM